MRNLFYFENLPKHIPRTLYGLIEYARWLATPEEIIILSDVTNISVRLECAKRNDCPIEALTKLSQDHNVEVRSAVAMNKSAPKSIIGKLMFDDQLSVQELARKHKNAKDLIVFD